MMEKDELYRWNRVSDPGERKRNGFESGYVLPARQSRIRIRHSRKKKLDPDPTFQKQPDLTYCLLNGKG